MSSLSLRARHAGRRPAVPAGTGLLVRLFDTLALWQERARGRRALSELDARLLGDIGLSPADVDMESSKPFWRT